MLSYKPLWHTLLNKNIKKLELCQIAGISTATLAKLGKDKVVTTDILNRLCKSLNCRIDEVVEFVPDTADNKNT